MTRKIQNNNLLLIGMMGSGKSTIGKKLTEILQESQKYAFMDTDELIENKFGKSIPAIFLELGEKKFRQNESQILSQLQKDKVSNCIISTGGGIILKQENQEILKSLGLVVWLNASPQTILTRLKNDTSRPLLSIQNREENKQDKISEILDSRFPKYKETADLIINVDQKSIDQICKEIIEGISEF